MRLRLFLGLVLRGSGNAALYLDLTPLLQFGVLRAQPLDLLLKSLNSKPLDVCCSLLRLELFDLILELLFLILVEVGFIFVLQSGGFTPDLDPDCNRAIVSHETKVLQVGDLCFIRIAKLCVGVVHSFDSPFLSKNPAWHKLVNERSSHSEFVASCLELFLAAFDKMEEQTRVLVFGAKFITSSRLAV